MHRVGQFCEYDINSDNDRIKAAEAYIMRLTHRSDITYRECVQFIASHAGNIQFAIDSLNYEQCCADFLDGIAPHLMVFLQFHGLGSSIIAENVYRVGQAWSGIKLREAKEADLAELYSTNPDPTKEEIAEVLRKGDVLKQITDDFKMKPEDIILFAIEGVDAKNPEHMRLKHMLDRVSHYVNEQEGNYVVKVLPTTSHVDMMMLANGIYSSF